MENSAKNDWGKGRLVPVALVFLGLICASWLSIGSEAEMKETNTSYLTKISKHTTASDTSREDGLKVIKSNKHKAQEEIDRIERFEFDTDEFEMPPMPDIDADFDMAMDVFDDMPAIDVPSADFGFPALRDGDWNVLRFDSLPGFRFRMRDNPEEFERFEKEFTQKFREEFKEFYEKNHEQLEEMMREIEKERRDAAEVVDLDQMRLRAKIESDRARISADKIRQDWLLKQDIPGAVVAPRPFREFPDLPALQEPLEILDGKIAQQKDMIDEMARNFDAYQKEVTALLIEDGYLDKGESIENLSINDDGGDLTINGKKIKEKDQFKYRALHDQYFQQRYKREGYHRRQE